MADKKIPRANEWRFGAEIKPPANPTIEELEAWKRAERGTLPEPENVLEKIVQEVGAAEQLPKGVVEDLNNYIMEISRLLSQAEYRPSDRDWEKYRAGRMALMFHYAFALGQSWSAVHGEFGKNGQRIATEKKLEVARQAGANSRQIAGSISRRRVTKLMGEFAEADSLYKNAVTDAAKKLDLSKSRVRQLFPKTKYLDLSKQKK